MEFDSLQEYIDEAMRRLSEVRGPLRAFRNAEVSSIPAGDLAEILDAVRSGAIQFRLGEISECAADTIMLVLDASEGKCPPIKPFESLSRLETLLLRKSLEEDYLALDLGAAFEDEPVEIGPEMPEFEFCVQDERQDDEPAEFRSGPETEFSSSVREAELEGFEIDEELLEIFAGEAEELLQNIGNSLSTLGADPNDKDALWEIRRNAHTFKGSAGIVGLKQISELAHRVEDLLDRMAESSADSNAGILNILRASFDCLKALTAGEKSAALFHRISQLYYDFDGVLAGLDVREESAPAEIPPTFVTADEPPAPMAIPVAEIPSVEEPAFPTFSDERPTVKSVSSRSVVRVSLDRLDEMVGVVRDLIIGRSAFEQRLKDLERQIEELHNTTRRLQTTSMKLEVDFEASMLTSDRSSVFNSTVLGDQSFGRGKTGFDELEFDKYTDFHQSTREIAEVTSDTFAINTALDVLRGNLESMFDDQRRLVDDLHEKLMRIRMVDFGSLSTRLQRAVKVTCEEEKKKANVSIENEAVDIDTQILDTLVEPLMHLLKNAVVHGIETPSARLAAGKPESGSIRVGVKKEDTHFVVTVRDDGRGIAPRAIVEKAISLGLVERQETLTFSDAEALDMIFLPGLSTAEKLNLSAGRGVGMSIVKESIQGQNGTVAIESKPGEGTTFTIRMPFPLVVSNVLIVEAGRRMYALPRKQAKQVIEVEGAVSGSIEIGGDSFTLLDVSERLAGGTGIPPSGRRHAVVVRSGEQDVAMLVDTVRGSEEVVIKPLGQPLDRMKGTLGAAILGSGDLVPILDIPWVVQNAGSSETISAEPQTTVEPEVITVMIVDDSPSVRHMTSKVISSAGWKVVTAKDGLDAIEQLRSAATLPAVILSDIEMPRMDGYELAASLQRSEEFNDIPVVMITSRSADKHREKAFDSGVSQYLTKPYDDNILLDTVRTLANIT